MGHDHSAEAFNRGMDIWESKIPTCSRQRAQASLVHVRYAITLCPTHPKYHLNAGILCTWIGDFVAVRAFFTESDRLIPGYVSASLWAGLKSSELALQQQQRATPPPITAPPGALVIVAAGSHAQALADESL
jgi:hypothetical protein